MNSLWQKLMLGGSTVALATAAGLSGATAQGDDIEQVVVSASRITIAGYTQPTPVTVVGAAQLEKNAFSNIADAVRELPSVSAPPSSLSSSNGAAISGTSGAEILSLRNLGSSRTLILFDGQRIVQTNIAGGVDINTIPSSVISRVDVVTGGASAAWGSDAVGGVVNFILNKNFDGLKADAEVSDTHDGKYPGYKVDVTWGGDFAGGRGHLIFAGNYAGHPDQITEDAENWYGTDSYWVSNPAYHAGNGQSQLIVAHDVGIASATAGGIIVSSPAGTGAAVNALRGIEFVGAGIPQRVDFGNLTLGTTSNGGSLTSMDGENQWTLVADSSNRYSAFAFGRYKLTPTIQMSLQLNYGYFSGKDMAQPLLQTAVVVKSDNAYLPASVKAAMTAGGITSFTMGIISVNNTPNNIPDSLLWQTAEGSMGPTVTTNQRQLLRGVLAFDGTIGDDWSWNAFYQHSTVRFWTHTFGTSRLSLMTLAQDSVTVTSGNRGSSGLPLGSIVCRSSLTAPTNGCIPLDIFGNNVASPAAISYVTGHNSDYENMQTNQDEMSASMQGTLPWELPAGKVAVVFGVGFRQEAGVNFADPAGAQADFATGNWIFFPPTHTNDMEGFAELDAPILKNNIVQSLDLSMAGRMTSYSTSGLVETWKLGLTSQIIDDLRIRGTWSVDIRAPGLTELFAVNSRSNSATKDPKTGVSQSVFTDTQGNPNLNPETARTISVGVVLTPRWIEGLTTSVDYYYINLTSGIAPLSSSVYLTQCNPTAASVIHPGQLGNPNDPLCTHLIFNGSNGALAYIEQTPINIASESTSGFDIQANYAMDFWNGNLAWQAVANYNDEHTTAQPGTATSDSAGTGGSPKWKGIVSADYTTGPYSVTPQIRWFGTSKIISANTGNQATPQTIDLYPTDRFEIPIWAYLDLRGNYKFNDNMSFYGAIDNVLDTPPPNIPLSPNSIIHSIPTNGTTYDLIGRQYRIGVRFNY